jgi:hypothetical protein
MKTEAEAAEKAESSTDKLLKPADMKRAVLAWLAAGGPTGLALSVPTRISKYQADAAAFWSVPGRKRLMYPEKTVIVEIRKSREQCWPDCSRHEELLPLLRLEKEKKVAIESVIRKEEPELKDTDTLFPEYESWDYRRSRNKNYHSCLRRIEKIEHALYKGSRFEQIRRAHVADYLYLAVPEGTVAPQELADGWGLLFIRKDMSVEIVKEAENWNCPPENKLHLVQNIAACTLKNTLFANGITVAKNGKTSFIPVPRKRRAKRN